MAQNLRRRRARRRLAALAFLSDISLQGTGQKPGRDAITKREVKQRISESRAQKIHTLHKRNKSDLNDHKLDKGEKSDIGK